MLHEIVDFIVQTVGDLGYMGIFFYDVFREYFFPISK